MHKIKLYPSWEEGEFYDRPNRFTLRLKKNGRLITTYIQNTGRMEEFLTEKAVFYYVPVSTPKFRFKTVATKYQNSFVFLETSKINDIFELLIKHKKLPFLSQDYKREFSVQNSRFDFAFFKNKHLYSLTELKSCTLCHNNRALFPDAPTERGRKHIRQLDSIKTKKNFIIYLITNRHAEIFFPNFHTDIEYAEDFLEAEHLNFRAYSITFSDPVTFDIDSLKKIKISRTLVSKNLPDKGSYLLLFYNPKKQKIEIGKLGTITFARGYYVYAGSALSSLSGRLNRHKKKKKKNIWHVDYLQPAFILKKIYPIRRTDRIESVLASDIKNICDYAVENFGSSDTKDISHLFYFKNSPAVLKSFHNIILKYRTFTEKERP